MFKYIFMVLLSTDVYGQQTIEQYVRQNTVAIATVAPDSAHYADLSALGEAIGESKVVFLGEQDHGDATTFLAKTRIIKYLHETKGFDVLAFESDFFSLTSGWDSVQKSASALSSFLSGNIFGVWTQCDACRQLLFQYIPDTYKTGNPLIITGFDDQLILAYSYHNLFAFVDSALKAQALPITKQPSYETVVLPLIKSINDPSPEDNSMYNKREQYLREIRQQLAGKPAADEYLALIIDNLISQNVQNKYRTDKRNYWTRTNIRDNQMALNLQWLCQKKFPGKKVIVWAHNYHISKYNGHYEEDFMNEAHTMGEIFTSDSIRKTNAYIIGFTSYGGEAGRVFSKKYDVPKPVKNSYENWIDKKYDYAFTDFQAFNKQAPPAQHDRFFMSGSVKGPQMHTYSQAEWNRIFDGVFFIRNMVACAGR